MSYLKIGELAGLTETNNETLRFYETKGLLPAPRRSEAGYRLFTQKDVDRVRFIVRARRMGFTLREVTELLSLQVEKSSATCGDVKELAELKLIDIDERIAELNRMKNALKKITDACVGGEETAEHCTILNALAESSDPRVVQRQPKGDPKGRPDATQRVVQRSVAT
jgi:MerR family Zn(II)-responsive transcriptional regulator of zntA